MTAAGTFNGWAASVSNMTLVDNYTWEWTAVLTNETGVQFKFAAAGTWSQNWGDDDPTGLSLPLQGIGESNGANIAVSGTLDGTYIFTFNDRTRAYSLERGPSNPDADGDGMPDDWENTYFGSTNAVHGGAYEDWDEDGASNLDEWYAGTIPTDDSSVFTIVSVAGAANYVVSWASETGKTYTIWVCTNLLAGEFTPSTAPISSTSPMNTHTIVLNEASSLYYRLSVDDE